jgi:CRP/FNR family transcriptional regulator, transcriptional activator FtrB
MRADDEVEVAALPFFAGLAPESVRLLLTGAYLQRFPSRIELIQQGDPADFLHVVLEGQIEVYAGHQGRETTISILGPGDSFIVAAVFLDKVYLKSARTISPARLLLLPATAVRGVFNSDPAFTRRMATELAKGYRLLVKELNNLKLRTSLERLANWILRQAPGSSPAASFTFPFDKRTLAAKLGITPEVLSRNFASLTPYGVTISGKSVIVRDRDVLEKFAKPSPLIDDPRS